MKDMDWQNADANPEQLAEPMDIPADAINVDGIIYYSAEAVGELCAIHRKLERERIIKELEERSLQYYQNGNVGYFAIQNAIALIKGEEQ